MSWDSRRRGFIFIWKIENFSYCFQKRGEDLDSPLFVFETAANSSAWHLCLQPRGQDCETGIGLYLRRYERDNNASEITITYELAILTCDGSPPKVGYEEKHLFFRKHRTGFIGFLSRDAALSNRFTLNDTLTVRCRMRNESLTQSHVKPCFARTRIGIQRFSLISSVDRISSMKAGDTRTIPIKLHSTEKIELSMTLFMAQSSEMRIKIVLTDKDHPKYVRSTIAVVNTTGYTTILDEDNHWVETSAPEQVWNHVICMNKGMLMANTEIYLPNDTLYLYCKIGIVHGIQINEIEDVDVGLCYAHDCNQIHSDNNKQPFYFNKEPSDSKLASLDESPDYKNHVLSEPCYALDFKQLHSGDTEQTSNLEVSSDCRSTCSALLHDLQCAFKERILCDVTLRTESEMFSAHSFILSARSTVFKAMFSDCVDILDLDAGTVRQMLTYLYTDIVEDLDIDPASKLYFAADKYDIVSLKEKCSSLLKAKLSESKACDVLVLADMHQDSDLKAAVQDFILKKDKEILRSKEWKDFQRNNLELANETLLLVYLKKLES